MEDFFSWIYEILGLRFPKAFLTLFIIGGAAFGYWLAKKSESAHNDSFGIVEGHIKPQGGGDIKHVVIDILKIKNNTKSISRLMVFLTSN